MLCCNTLRYAVLCYVASCYVALRCVTLCYVALCDCDAILVCAVLFSVVFVMLMLRVLCCVTLRYVASC